MIKPMMNIFMHRYEIKPHLDVDRMYMELWQLSQHTDTMYEELYTSQCIHGTIYIPVNTDMLYMELWQIRQYRYDVKRTMTA